MMLNAGTDGNMKESITFDIPKKSKVLFVDKLSGGCRIDIPHAYCRFEIANTDYDANGNIFLRYFHFVPTLTAASDNITLNVQG